MPRVAAFAGRSGSGKTTVITNLIRRYRELGLTVGAIKHTHHPLNEENRGDTARFREAGADPVILAGDSEAVVFGATTTRVKYDDPFELLTLLPTDIIFIEGFKKYGAWLTLDVDRSLTSDAAALILDRIWPP